jgi:hypothetical protein
MADMVLGLALLFSLAATAVLYWLRVAEQVRDRRIQQRLSEIRHVTAVVRAFFAEQRAI